jgi:tetratricopeptide (TPR) repeat protein
VAEPRDFERHFAARANRPFGTPRTSSSLPPDPADFTGRQEALQTLDGILGQSEEDRPHAVIMEGMPGVGKTALTIHWAHTAADAFPDGYLYTDLRGDADLTAPTRDEVLWQILITLGIPGGQIPEAGNGRAQAYQERISGKRILIVLDNVRDEAQVKGLLPLSASSFTVMTSRSHLRQFANDDRVIMLKLGVLTPDEALDLVTTLVGPERVSREPGAAKDLVEICGYLPLALRIIAANLASSPGTELADGVAELERERLSALTLHTDPSITIRTTLDLSYRGLDEELRRTFRLLGLFPGRDITTKAAAALLDSYPEDAEILLAKLRLANLIDETAPGRYRFHDLLRDYARERADNDENPPDRQAAIHRLLTWYLTTARDQGDFLGQRRRRMDGPRVPRTATHPEDREHRLSWFEAERQNLVAITKQAAEQGEDRLTWELADAVYDFLQLRSYASDNVEVHRLGLAAAQRTGELTAQVYMYHHLSVIHKAMDQYDVAQDEAEKATKAAVRIDDRYFEAAARNNLAEVHYAMGRYDESLRIEEDVLAIRRSIGDQLGEAQTLNSIGRTQQALGRYEEAFQNVHAALAIRREIRDPFGEAETLDTLSRLYRIRSLYHRALECGDEALKIRRERGDRIGEGKSMQSLARVYRRLGLYGRAQEYAEQALEIMKNVGNEHGVAEAYATLGDIYLDSSREYDALDPYEQAMEIRRRIRDSRGISEGLLSLARAHRKLGDVERSLEDGQSALAISKRIGDRFGEARALDSQARAYPLVGEHDKALALARKALRIQRTIGDRRGEGNSLDNMAHIYCWMRRYGPALEFARQAFETLTEDGDRRGQAKALDTIARAQLALRRPDLAIDAARTATETWAELGDKRSLVETLGVLVSIAEGRNADPEQSGPATRRARNGRSLAGAFASGFGGIFDLFGPPEEFDATLPSFESALADAVHEQYAARGLAADDDTTRADHPAT